MPTQHSRTKRSKAQGIGSLADQLLRSVTRSFGGGLALHQIVNASGELLAGEWRALQSLGKLIAKETTAYTPAFHQAMQKLGDELEEIVPKLAQAVETLAAIEQRILEVTGVESSSADGVSLAAEELQSLRDRVGKWSSEFHDFKLNRNLGQTIAAAIETLRFIIGAIAIIKLGIQIAEQLNSRTSARQSSSRASAQV